MTAPAASLATAIGHLATDGFAVIPDYFDGQLCQALKAEACALDRDPAAIDAGIGRHSAHATDPAIRHARIRWLDAATEAQQQFLGAAETLRLNLNQRLFLGLFSFEAQLALTPPGGFYARHLDSFRGARNRIVSLVAYLSEDWQAADGGCLRIWPPSGVSPADPQPEIAPAPKATPPIDVEPQRGTLVLMLSEVVPHAVLPAHRARPSVAGWFRVNSQNPISKH